MKYFRSLCLALAASLIAALPVYANQAPVAVGGSFVTDINVDLKGTVSATDAEKDPLTFRIVTQPAHGSISAISSAGAFTYSPVHDYHGPDSFAFVANDGTQDSAPVMVKLKVNAPPVSNAMALVLLANQNSLGTLSGSDPDGDPLTYKLNTGPTQGTVSISSDGQFTYAPNPDFIGADSFMFTVSDGRLTSQPATVSLTVTKDAFGFIGDTLLSRVTSVLIPTGSGSTPSQQVNLQTKTPVLDLAVDRANRRLYVLTASTLERYDIVNSASPATLTYRDNVTITGTRLALSLDARTAYIGGTGKITAINLYPENVYESTITTVNGKVNVSGKSVTWAAYKYVREFPFSDDLKTREVGAMGVHPMGNRLLVFIDMKAADKKLNINNNLLRSDVGNGQSAATVTLPGDFGYLTQLDISADAQTTGKMHVSPQLAPAVDLKKLIYPKDKSVAIGIKSLTFSPDGNTAFLSAVGAQTPRATPFGIMPTSDEGTGGIVVLDVRPHDVTDPLGWVQFLSLIPTTERGENTAALRLQIQQQGWIIVHPEVQFARNQYLTALGQSDLGSGNPFTAITTTTGLIVASDVLNLLEQSYQDYGYMQAYFNLYPRDMVGASSVAINHTGDFGVVTLQDTNNLGLLSLSPAAALPGYSLTNLPDFYIKTGTGKSINGFDAALGNGGPSGWAYSWAYPQKVVFTSDDTRILIGMAGGTPKADLSNKFGSADALMLRTERDKVDSIFKSGNPPPGYALVSGPAQQSPRLAATLQSFDFAHDQFSDHLKAYNRWNSLLTLPNDPNGTMKGSLISTTLDEVTTPGVPLPATTFPDDAMDKALYLPSSGIGYRLDNQGLPALSVNAGSRSAISAIERLGKLWHDAYLANQVSRPYFVVGAISMPGGGVLKNGSGELLQYGSRNGFQVNFPYMSTVKGDLPHDFVTSNVTATPLNNKTEVIAGFDQANMAKFLALLLAEPTVSKIEIDPAVRDTVPGIDFTSSKFVVHGARNRIVTHTDGRKPDLVISSSRRDLDSEMSVSFSTLALKTDPLPSPSHPLPPPVLGQPAAAPGRIPYQVTLPPYLNRTTMKVRLPIPASGSLGDYVVRRSDGTIVTLGKDYTVAELFGTGDSTTLWIDVISGHNLQLNVEILSPELDNVYSLQGAFKYVQWTADDGPLRRLANCNPKAKQPDDNHRTILNAETIGFDDTITYHIVKWVPAPNSTPTKAKKPPTLDPVTGEVISHDDAGTLYVEAIATHNATLRTRPLAIEVGGCGSGCDSGTCPTIGNIDLRLDSVHFEVSDGNRGKLFVTCDFPVPALSTPMLLEYPYHNKDTQLILDAAGAIRQVKTAQTLMDVRTVDTGYVVDTYTLSSSPLFDPKLGIFTIDGLGKPTTSLEVAKIDDNSIKLTKHETGTPVSYAFAYSTTDYSWTMREVVDPATDTEQREQSIALGTQLLNGQTLNTKTITMRGPDGAVVAKEVEAFADFPDGSRLISHTSDPDGANRTTSYQYNDQGDVTSITSPDGSWMKSEYDGEDREIKRIEPWLNSPSTADPSACKVTTFDYTPLVATSADPFLPEAPRTTVVTIAGVETERIYSNYAPNVQQTFVATHPGAAWDDPTNLVTTVRFVPNGSFAGRTASVESPDGTLALYTYSNDARGEVTVVKQGAPNSYHTAIVDGSISTSVLNSAKQEIFHSVVDIVSGLTLDERIALAVDSSGRPLQWHYLDGSISTTVYDCCGVESQTDRAGITTFFDHDAFKRVSTARRLGLTTRYDYDSSGRVHQTVRIGTDGSGIVLSRTDYLDLTGEKINSYDALNRLTHTETTYNADGTTTRTTTLPGGFTQWQISARDGHPLETGGTAASPMRYDYRVAQLGAIPCNVTRAIARVIDETTGLYRDTAEWTESWADMAGRQLRQYMADGAYTAYFYNEKNQMVRAVDPDGVTTLYAYNARGEHTVSAIDVNRNGLIDYAGTDHLTRTFTTYANKLWNNQTIPVARTTTEIWSTAGADSPLLVSTQEQSIDGHHSWTFQNEALFHQETIYPAMRDGSWQVITTAPDQTSSVQSYAAGRLASVSQLSALSTQLSSTTYTYDPHGRVLSTTDSRLGTTTLVYYADDQVATITAPHPAIAGQFLVTTNTYDARGLLQTRSSSVLLATGSSLLATTTSTYTPQGQLASVHGSQTYPIQYTYDAQGRVLTMTTWKDFAGNTGQAVTRWNYDPLRGWLTSKTYDASTGLGTQGPTYSYTYAGRLSTRTWARGVSTQYSYQPDGALATVDYSDTTPDLVYQYYRHGQVKEVRDGVLDQGVISDANLRYRCNFTYDPALRLAGDNVQTFGHYEFTRQYETAGTNTVAGRYHGFTLRTEGATDPFYSASYAYDNAGRVSSVSQLSPLSSQPSTYTYNYRTDASLLDSVTGPTLTTSYTYQPQGNGVLTRTNSVGSTVISQYGYTLNALGQRTAVTQTGTAFTAPTHYAYKYNDKGELTNGDHFDGADPAHPGPLLPNTFAYNYDDIGNRTTTTLDSGLSTLSSSTYTTNALNQYNQIDSSLPATRSSLLQYDPDGNLTADEHWTYTWNAENRLVVMEAVGGALRPDHSLRLEFSYDYQGRRVAKDVSNWNGTAWVLGTSTRFLYDGWNLVAEFNLELGTSNLSLLRSYLWGLDLSGTAQGAGGVGGLLAINQVLDPISHLPSPNSYSAAFDANGNLTGLIEATGTLAASYEYDPFGNTIKSAGPAAAANPFRFSTKYTDDESGLLYYGFRYYNSNDGRWLSRDQIQEQGGSNLYSPDGNDLTNSVDFLGAKLIIAKKEQSLSDTSYSAIGSDTKRQEIAEKMINDKVKYKFLNCDEFVKHVNYRITSIEIMDEVNSGGIVPYNIGYPHDGYGYQSNPQTKYWKVTQAPNAGPRFEYEGVDSYKALRSFMKGPTIAECQSTLEATYLLAFAKALPDESRAKDFNKLYPNGLHMGGSNKDEVPVAPIDMHPSGDTIIPGDWVYFSNLEYYDKYHPRGGVWRGENAIYAGLELYTGFGAVEKTIPLMRTALMDGWNQGLNPKYPKQTDETYPKELKPKLLARPNAFQLN